jgi:hypothetical protein
MLVPNAAVMVKMLAVRVPKMGFGGWKSGFLGLAG